MFRAKHDANLDRIVTPVRLRSSFIYLANAVNDLNENWQVFPLVLAPLILLASLCLLPDALNLQHRFAQTFESGDTHAVNVAWHVSATPVQVPYGSANRPKVVDPFPDWVTNTLHVIFLLITIMVNLVVFCALARKQKGARAPTATAEAIEVYRQVVTMTPAFLWVFFLQAVVIAAVCLLFLLPLQLLYYVFFHAVIQDYRTIFPLVIPPGLLVLVFVYFAQIALVFDGVHSWGALLHSRDVQRRRFLKVATRILVFLAVWSGYNSWATGAFVIASIYLGPVVAVTGYLWGTLFVLDLIAVSVEIFTTAFFMAAGVRLYQDLIALKQEDVGVVKNPALQQTTDLPSAVSSAS